MRAGLQRRRRLVIRRQRRNRALGALAVVGGAFAAWAVVRRFQAGQEAPEWPSKKKLARDARREEAARRAREPLTARPPEVHVERDAERNLKAPLGDLTH